MNQKNHSSDNTPALRFPEFTEAWEKKKLGEVATFLDGKRRPIKSSERSKIKGIYPYYGASGIIDYVNDYIFDAVETHGRASLRHGAFSPMYGAFFPTCIIVSIKQ
ncbi:MAG: hypothetical protein EAZ57_07935 [Cytophagales bacterium]|nr:MAG: hypothetical protein EAZ67_09015 [Cytophagales bacterium]TAF60264.1 MAG: hypothetical protein EAZ57_07935 [Cytophagales bacterium]